MAKQSLYVTAAGTDLRDWCERHRTVLRAEISQLEGGLMSVVWNTPGKEPLDITAKTLQNGKKRLAELDAILKSRLAD